MICRDGSVGAAGQTAPTKGYQPPLKMRFVVVPNAFRFPQPLADGLRQRLLPEPAGRQGPPGLRPDDLLRHYFLNLLILKKR